MKASTSLQDLQDLEFYKPINLHDLRTYQPTFEPFPAWWPTRGRRGQEAHMGPLHHVDEELRHESAGTDRQAFLYSTF